VYTDVWISAGMEEQATRRRVDFRGFQVNSALMQEAKPEAIVLHCLPARRGEEITDEVLDGPQCAAFDQAENRLHTQRALLSLMLS
jgi:ornithine carbamoyltransferase